MCMSQAQSSFIVQHFISIFIFMCIHIPQWIYPAKISDMLNKNSLGPLKKGTAKQSGIKRIIWHLRWLVRARAYISLRPSG